MTDVNGFELPEINDAEIAQDRTQALPEIDDTAVVHGRSRASSQYAHED